MLKIEAVEGKQWKALKGKQWSLDVAVTMKRKR
jgi:hypothetical protein